MRIEEHDELGGESAPAWSAQRSQISARPSVQISDIERGARAQDVGGGTSHLYSCNPTGDRFGGPASAESGPSDDLGHPERLGKRSRHRGCDLRDVRAFHREHHRRACDVFGGNACRTVVRDVESRAAMA